jgi:hypothetical protein
LGRKRKERIEDKKRIRKRKAKKKTFERRRRWQCTFDRLNISKPILCD